MSNSNAPAGWYPDPEAPGQSRYWDGTRWAAPTPAAEVAGGGGGDGGGNRPVLLVIAIVVALALIGGGAWALTRGDDDGEVASEDDGDEDRDDEEPRDDEEDEDENEDAQLPTPEQAAAVFRTEADAQCLDILESVRDIPLDYFPAAASPEDILAVGPDVLEEFRNEVLDAIAGPYDELRDLVNPTSDEAQENWLIFVDDWQETYGELVDHWVRAELPLPGTMQYRLDLIGERAFDFGMRCFEEFSQSSSPAPDADDDGGNGGDGGVVAGAPTEPPSLGNGTLDVLAQTCYFGDMEACDSLYLATPIGSPGESYGDTCGGRTDGGTPCRDITDPVRP